MLDRSFIRSNPDSVRDGATLKRIEVPLDEFLTFDAELRTLKTELDRKRAESNATGKTIGELMRAGKKDEAASHQARGKRLREEISLGEERERELEARLLEIELQIPNMPHESVPIGTSEEDNQVVLEWGERPSFSFPPKPHWEIAESLGIIDFAAGSKISGSGFIVYRGFGARLQRALFNYMVDFQTQRRGYIEIYPPFVVNRASLVGTGQLPKFEEDLYLMERDDLFLIPTAEVPVTNIHRDEILDAEQLPIKYAAFSACFRREAGAAGKDTRGLLRVHEFDKVELVKFCTPESSYEELETMRGDAEAVLQSLGLCYRTVMLCTAELSFSNAKCYDLEIWAPAIEKHLEISSASNFEAFQARRANIRYRPEQGAKPQFVHTLNASGVALPRLMAVLLETNQQEDGSVKIPEPLRPYVGTDVISAT